MKKRVIGITLALTIILAMLPSTLFATTIASGNCGADGDNLTWILEDGVLTISGSGDMADYSSYGSNTAPWSGYKNSIEEVMLEVNVTSIGNYAFYNCSFFTSVTIPNSVTSIGYDAFEGCTSLTSVTIPDSVTSIGYDAFEGCTSLTTVTIMDGVTDIGNYMFDDCSSLTSVTIPDSVTNIGYGAFYGCSSLTSVTIPDGVTTIWYGTFYDCSSLTSVSIPNSVTSIEARAFSYCERLASVTIPNSMTRIGDYAFSCCKMLTNVDIPNSVTEMGCGVFLGCDSLTNVTVPSSISTIEEYTFFNCESLSEITIPASVATIEYSAFESCVSLASIELPNSVESIGYSAFSNTGLTSVTIPNSVEELGAYVFQNCNQLQSVELTNGIRRIEYFSFDGCTSLGEITVPSGVESICGGAFQGSGIQTATIPATVTKIDEGAFAETDSLTDVYFDGTEAEWTSAATSNDYIGLAESVIVHFSDGESGTTIVTSGTCGDPEVNNGEDVTWTLDSDGVLTISGEGEMANYSGSTSAPWYLQEKNIQAVVIKTGVTSIGDWAFAWHTSLTSVTIPDSVTSVGADSFYSCDALKSVTIPDSVTSIGEAAFNNCKKLISVTIGDGVTSIGEAAFNNCLKLTSVTIGDSVTSIGDFAFAYCAALASVTIPNSVTSIGRYAFYRCSSLESVTIPDSVTSIGEIAFSACSKLKAITVDNGNNVYKDIDSVLFSADGTLLHTYPAGKTASAYMIPNSVTSIGTKAFSGCTLLTSVTIPNSVTSIGDYAFDECRKLTSIAIPNSVTCIEEGTFELCDALTSVTIPGSVTSVGEDAFYGCTALTDIYYGSTEAEWTSATTSNEYIGLADTVTVHYNSLGPVPTKTPVMPDAVKFVPYSTMLDGVEGEVIAFRADTALPAWLTLDADTGELSGIPTEVGTYALTVTVLADDVETVQYSMTLTVKDNTTAAVTQESATELKIEQTVSNMTTESLSDQVFEIEDKVEEVKSNFEKFLDVYLDGVKLNGGKVGENETVKTVEDVPDEWEYFAEEGSTKITVRAQTFQKKGTGTHTIAATFNKTDPVTGKVTGETISAAQNFIISTPDSDDDDSTSQTTMAEKHDDGTIQYTVKDGVAQVDAKSIDKLTENAKNNSILVLDFTTAGQTVTTAKLPAGMIDRLAKLLNDNANKAESLTVKLTSGTLTFDAESLTEIAKQAGGAEVSLTLTDVAAASLSAQQQEALKSIGTEKVVFVEIKAGSKQITGFGGGRVAIGVPFTVPTGRNARGYAAWYLAADAGTTRHSTAYVSGALSFRTAHFSYYAIAYQVAKTLTDVPDDQWYASDVNQMISLGLMNGVSETRFAPEMELDRAMIAQILYKLDKAEAGAPAVFEDVSENEWYADAVNWAADAGIVDGVGNGKYAPTRNVTRGELVAMLYKYAKYKQYDVSNIAALERFPDSETLPDWMKSAMQWAVGTKLISGINGNLAANEKATRAQTAKVLTYFLEFYDM